MLHGVLVPIHSSNVGREIVSSRCRNSDPITCLQDGHQETPATKAAEGATPWREPRDICALATLSTFRTQEEMVLAQTGQCCLLLPKKKEKSLEIHLTSS